MIKQITHIRVKNSDWLNTESILEVKLASAETRPIKTVIQLLDIGKKYYYLSSENSMIYIEAVFPIYKGAYIRSCDYDGVYDNLMNLPHF